MCDSYVANEGAENESKISFAKSDDKSLFDRPRCRGHNGVCTCGLESTAFGIWPFGGCCDHDNEPWAFISGGESNNQLSDEQFLKADCATCSWQTAVSFFSCSQTESVVAMPSPPLVRLCGTELCSCSGRWPRGPQLWKSNPPSPFDPYSAQPNLKIWSCHFRSEWYAWYSWLWLHTDSLAVH
jgi:hypothetical protein